MATPESHSHFLLITSVDSYLGHTLARYLMEELARRRGQLKKHWRVRVLCEDRNQANDLERLGADVQQVDYDNQAMIRKQMKHVKCMIFVPNMSSRRVPFGVNLIESASLEKVKSVQMLSTLYASDAPANKSPMGEFHSLEEHLRQVNAYGRWCIFRLAFVQQTLCYWSRMIEDRGVLGMPLGPEDALSTVHVKDVCESIATMLLSPQKQENPETEAGGDNEEDEDAIGVPSQAVRRIFELTSNKAYRCETMAKKLDQTLQPGGKDITYAEMSTEDLREYLQTMSESASHASFLDMIPSSLLERAGREKEDAFVPNPRRFLTPALIDMIVDVFHMARCKTHPTVTNDVRNLTGREPCDLVQFFMENQPQFHRPQGSP